MRYGPLHNDQTKYMSPDHQIILTESQVKDLGILTSSGGDFGAQIEEKSKKSKQISGWILQTFKTREAQPMIILFKSLVLPILEYCCQLWSPDKLGLMRKLESVQRNFASKLSGLGQLHYGERLRKWRMYSLEKRRD